MAQDIVSDIIGAVASSPATPATLLLTEIALIITAFVRGWIVPRGQVKTLLDVQNLRINEANKRAGDWQAAYYAEAAKNAVLAQQLDTLKVVGVAVDKILSSLPAPRSGAKDEKVPG